MKKSTAILLCLLLACAAFAARALRPEGPIYEEFASVEL